MAPTVWSQHSETIISTSIGIVVTVLVSYYFFKISAASKHLVWMTLADAPLVAPSAQSLLQVTYGGVAITNPRRAVIRILCSGNRGIDINDFREPLRIQMACDRIYSVDLLGTSTLAARPNADLAEDGRTIVLSDLYLDHYEFIDIAVIVSSQGPLAPVVRARVFGQTRQAARATENSRETRLLLIGAAGTFVALAVVVLWEVFIRGNSTPGQNGGPGYTTVLLTVIALGVFLTWLAAWRRKRRYSSVPEVGESIRLVG